MPRVLLAFLAIGVLAMMAMGGLQAGLENAGEDHTVTNESWTPNPGTITELSESNRTGAYYANSVTVRDENGSIVAAGEDYRWYVENGTVEALAGGELDGDSEATITYSFQQTTADQREWAAVMAQIPRAGGAMLLLAPVLFLIVLFRGGM